MYEPNESRSQQEVLEVLYGLKQFAKSKIWQMRLQVYVDEDDLLQDVAISIMASRQSPSLIANPKAYLRTCILNRLLKIKKIKDREKRSNQPIEELLTLEVPVPQESDIEVKIRFHVMELNPIDRKIIEYAFFEGLKAPQIAERLCAEGHSFTSTNVRQRKKRAIDRLREIF